MKLSIVSTVAVESPGGQRSWDLEGYVAELRAAERLGFYGAYTGERRGRGGASGKTAVTTSPELLCMYGLSQTESLVVGTQITLLPLHHPVRIIQDACVINTLYPGRFRLGVGAGYTSEDFRAFGVPLEERGRRMEAGMEAIRAFIDERPIELSAPYCGAIPAKDPGCGHPPEIMMGGWSRAGMRRAARLGDGWLSATIRTVTAEAELAALYRTECRKLGKPARVVLSRDAGIAVTDAEAQDRFGGYPLAYARIYFERGGAFEARYEPWVTGIASSSEITLDMAAPDRFLIGSVETWLSTLAEWKKTIDPDEVVIRLRNFNGPSLQEELEQMELIGREVIPVLADL